MFDFLDRLADLQSEIEHISAITGVSIGVLAALAALAWFDPLIRTIAIRLGIAVIVAYLLVIGSYHLGAVDVRAQWDAANARAATAAAARDADIAKQLAADNPAPTPAQQQQAIDDENKVLSELSSVAACQLGADALRLRK
jgi:hypothetical protein